jgi:hypothetical protein
VLRVSGATVCLLTGLVTANDAHSDLPYPVCTVVFNQYSSTSYKLTLLPVTLNRIQHLQLAPNKKALLRATGRYKRLNSAALKLVAPGGLLLTFSCSGAMTQSGEFVPMVQSAAIAVNRPVTLLRTLTAAADHVVNPAYPEGAYLTGAMLFCP